MSKEITAAIKVWWLALKAYYDVSDEKLAQLIEATAWRAGAKSVQPLNRQNVSTWRSRGSFPPMDASLQSAVVQLMAAMAREVGAPEGVSGWIDVAELHRAWMASRAGLEEAPHARTVEANKRKVQGLADALVDDPERTVEEATSLEGLRDGFWQGSWVTGNEAPPYVPRSIDAELDRELKAAAKSGRGGFLVVVGEPKAGKTRTLLEALRRTMPDRRLWQLQAVDGGLDAIMGAVAADGGRPGPYDPTQVVVLLDDLQRHSFHTTTGVNDKTLNRAIHSGLLIVATLHQSTLKDMKAYAMDRTRSGPRDELALGATPPLIGMLDDARMELPAQLTDEELAGLPPELADRRTLADVPRARLEMLPELLAAVDSLFARADQGRSDTGHPERAAIIQAGIDASHIYPAGATLEELEQLSQWAFQHLFPTRHWDPYLFLRAFAWATSPLGGPGSSHAIVRPVASRHNAYQLFDPLVDRLSVWPWDPAPLTPHVDSFDTTVCFEIWVNVRSFKSLEHEVQWLTRAATELPQAMNSLAAIHAQTGRLDLAEDCYLRAIEAGSEESELLACGVGLDYAKTGRMAEAERWLLQIADLSADPGLALLYLTLLQCDLGDTEEAVQWIMRSDGTHEDPTPFLWLSHRFLEQGDIENSEKWLGRAAVSRYGETFFRYGIDVKREAKKHKACPDLAKSLRESASFSLYTAACLGHPEAMERLAAREAKAGDLGAAAALRNRVSEPSAWVDLMGRGAMHLARGEKEEARTWLEQAAELGRPEAMWALGNLLPEAEAEELWRESARLGYPEAMYALAEVHDHRGQHELAELWFLEAAEQYHLPSIRHLAEAAEDPDEEERWWRKGAECYDAECMMRLGAGSWEHDRAEAERWMKKASHQKPSVLLWLALLNRDSGEMEQMEWWLNQAASKSAPQALAFRVQLAWEDGDREDAQKWWNKLVELEDDAIPRILRFLADHIQAEDPERAAMWLLAAESRDPSTVQVLVDRLTTPPDQDTSSTLTSTDEDGQE